MEFSTGGGVEKTWNPQLPTDTTLGKKLDVLEFI